MILWSKDFQKRPELAPLPVFPQLCLSESFEKETKRHMCPMHAKTAKNHGNQAGITWSQGRTPPLPQLWCVQHFAATIDHVIMVIHSQKLHNHLVSIKGHYTTTYCPSKDAITPNCHPFPLILQVVSWPHPSIPPWHHGWFVQQPSESPNPLGLWVPIGWTSSWGWSSNEIINCEQLLTLGFLFKYCCIL